MFNPPPEPNLAAALARLESLSSDQLKELLNDEEKFEEMIKQNQELLDLEAEKEEIMVRNRSLAEFNLTKEPKLEEAKRQIRELSEQGSKLCASVQAKLEELTNKAGSMTAETALELLQAATVEMEEESEKIAEKFLAGDLEVDEFLDQFLTRRKIMHERKVKVEKMKELMKRPPTTTTTTSSGDGSGSSSSSYPNPGYPVLANFPGMPMPSMPSVPYPTGIVPMPMPVPKF